MSFHLLEKFGNSVCLHTHEKEKITYIQLAKKSDQIVKNLPSRSLFALYFYPSIDCIAAYLGAIRNKHIALLIDPYLDKDLKMKLLKKFKISIFFNGKDWIKTNFHESIDNKDLSILLSTSGSTGSPKLIKISKRNLIENANSIVNYIGIKNNDKAISSLPFHYSYGLSILNTHLTVGAKVYLIDLPITNKVFWSFFKESQITGLAGVPATWRMLRKLYFDRMNLPSLKIITQAGGKLSNEEINWLAEIGKYKKINVFIMYGQTEATARISYLHPDMIFKKSGSIGKAIPGGKLYLKNDNDQIIDTPNKEGELIYQGENVMLGYASEFNDLNLDSNLEELYTGDLAYFDEDGYFWITGRKKRFIKLFGNRFSLDDIENFVINRGIETSVLGEDDKLIVVIDKKVKIDEKELITSISNYYRIHFSCIKVVKISPIPRNSAGKTEYQKLHKLCDLNN